MDAGSVSLNSDKAGGAAHTGAGPEGPDPEVTLISRGSSATYSEAQPTGSYPARTSSATTMAARPAGDRVVTIANNLLLGCSVLVLFLQHLLGWPPEFALLAAASLPSLAAAEFLRRRRLWAAKLALMLASNLALGFWLLALGRPFGVEVAYPAVMVMAFAVFLEDGARVCISALALQSAVILCLALVPDAHLGLLATEAAAAVPIRFTRVLLLIVTIGSNAFLLARFGSWFLARAAALQRVTARWRALTVTAPVSIVVVDPTGKVIEVTGRPLMGLRRRANLAEWLSVDAQALARLVFRDHRVEVPVQLAHAGPRILELNSATLPQGGAVVVVVDATDRRRHELEIIASRDKALEAGRVRQQFLGVIGHELRTPTAIVVAQAELAQELAAAGQTEAALAELGPLRTAAGALRDQIDDVLSLAGRDAAELPQPREPVEVAAWLRALVEEHRPAVLRSGSTVELKAAAGHYPLASDGTGRVIGLLLGHATETTAGGTILVAASWVEDGALEVVIEDDGLGPREAQLAFEPFATLDIRDSREQVGLGSRLALARRLAERLGADLTVEERSPRGTRSTVRIHGDKTRVRDTPEDRQKALRASLGEAAADPEFVAELYRTFVESLARRGAAMLEAMSAKDYGALADAAHAIKGSAGTMGERPLHDACRWVERVARHGPREELAGGVAEALALIEDARERAIAATR